MAVAVAFGSLNAGARHGKPMPYKYKRQSVIIAVADDAGSLKAR
ncbi:MAG: hypothetical protein ACKO85_15800 [Isosphaeraceae bacterium]